MTKYLRDVIAGQTKVCQLDEANKAIYYRGYAITDLCQFSSFEEVSYLLLYGNLPTSEELENFIERLRVQAQGISPSLFSTDAMYQMAHPMDRLGMMIRMDGNLQNVIVDKPSREHTVNLAERLIARMSIFVGLLKGSWVKPGYRNAENVLRLLGVPALNDEYITALATIFILYAEHEFNASTFSVRLAASAHTDLYSAITGAIGVLKGTRHGGANDEVMKLFSAIGTPEKVQTYCREFLEREHARIPGFGHAVYTVLDPRVPILKNVVQELSRRKGDTRLYEICLALEEFMQKYAREKGRGLPANVDLWATPVYALLGIPSALYTPLFAAARIAGWCAHYLEVRHDLNEPLLRPRAQYVGLAPRAYIARNVR